MSLTQWKTCSTTLRAADLAASATRSSSPTCERLLATTRGEPSLRDGPEGRGDHGLYDPAGPGQVAKLARGRGVGDLEGRHANEGEHRRRVPDLVLALAVKEAEADPRHVHARQHEHEVADPRPAHRGVGPPRPGVSTAGLPREGEPGTLGAGLGGAVGEPGAPGPALPSHAHLGVRECELCHADTPSLDATDLRLSAGRRYGWTTIRPVPGFSAGLYRRFPRCGCLYLF